MNAGGSGYIGTGRGGLRKGFHLIVGQPELD